MLEKALSTLAAVAIPAIGLLLRASRRNRLRQRIDEYLCLAERIESHSPARAQDFKRLASETAHILILRDERWLHRKVDPAAVFTLLLLTIPTATVFGLALAWDTEWKWLILIFTGIWTLLWGSVGVTQLWKERTDEPGAIN